MPLKPVLALAACLALAAPGWGEGSASVMANRYASSDGIAVFSPAAEAELDLDPRTELTMRYSLDAVSAASFDYSHSKTHMADPARATGSCFNCHQGVDAMSGATRDFRETRHQAEFGVKRRIGDSQGALGYTRSQENDYLSETLALAWSIDFFGGDSSLRLGVSHISDLINPVWTRSVSHTLVTKGVDLSLTQVLGRLTQAQAGLAYAEAQGFLSDPYAFVQIGSNTSAPEPARQPGQRQRLDATLALRQALPWDSSLELDYRYYQDSWEVKAHTLEFALTKQIGDWIIEPSYRWYGQSQAFFFRNFYDAPQPYITRDLKLAAFSTQMLGLELSGKLGEGLSLDLRYTHYLRSDALDYSLYYANGPMSGDAFQLGLTLE